MRGGLSGGLLVEDRIEGRAQTGFVADQRPQLLLFAGVVRFGNPEPEVTAFGVLFPQVRKTAFEVSLAVECGAVGQTVLHRTAEHGRGVDAAVGLGDDASVDRAGCMVGRGPVVLDGVALDGRCSAVNQRRSSVSASRISPEWMWCNSRPRASPVS